MPPGVEILDGNPDVKQGSRSRVTTEKLPEQLVFMVDGFHGLQLGDREALGRLDGGNHFALQKNGKVTISIDVRYHFHGNLAPSSPDSFTDPSL